MPAIGIRPWTPDKIPMVAWYDAADGSTVWEDEAGTIPATQSEIRRWDDKSGNGYHLTQPGGNTPQWGFPGVQIDGKNVMDYASTFDQLYKDSIPDINCTQFAHIGVVLGESGDWPAVGALFKTDNTDKLDHRYQSTLVDGQIKTVFTLDSALTSQSSASTPVLRELVPVLSSFWYDGDVIVTRANGGVVTSQNDVADGGTFTINKIQVGRETNTPQNWQGELIILDTADLATIQLVEGYLAWKWGMQASLAEDHPFKYRPPTDSSQAYAPGTTKLWTPNEIATAAWYDAADEATIIQTTPEAQEGVLDLAANGGINPHTGAAWAVGDKYRLAFTSSTTRDATSSDIADYNAHVQAAAAAAGLGSVNWKAFVSTPTVAAQDNVGLDAGADDSAMFNMASEIVLRNKTGLFRNGSITAAADAGGGQVTITAIGHGLQNGDTVYISGTSSYNGIRLVSNVTTDTFEITATFVSSQTGNWQCSVENKITYDENGLTLGDLPNDVPFYQFTPVWTGCEQWGAPDAGNEVGTAVVAHGISEAEKQYQFKRGTSSATSKEMYILAVSEVLTIQAAQVADQWNDKSGNARHLVQSITAKKPATGTRKIGALNALDFVNAVASGMRWSQAGVSIGDYHELYFVIDKDGLDSTRTLFHITEIGQSWYMDDYAYGGYGFRGTVKPSGGSQQFGTIREQIDQVMLGYNGVGYYKYVNGEQVGATANTPGTLPVDQISIGMNGFSGNSFDGLVGEVVIVPPQTTEGRQKIEGYLAWKWGFPHQLPATHPYKRRPPMV